MASRTPQAAGLSLEDFRRLGVRPHEFRLEVIRRAAIRSARGLAEQQLASPSPSVEVQLSRVAASTYRLLDPRRRRETSHRALVGRILPQALSWAGQTNFHSEMSDFRSTTGEMGKSPFERSSLSDAELIEMLDLDSSAKFKPQTKRDWTTSLSDVDLLRTTPISRRVARWTVRSRFPWLVLAASGLLFGAAVGFALHQRLSAEQVHALLDSGNRASSNSHSGIPTTQDRLQRSPSAKHLQHAASDSKVPRTLRRLVSDEMRERLASQGPAVLLPKDQTETESDRGGGLGQDLKPSGDHEKGLSSAKATASMSGASESSAASIASSTKGTAEETLSNPIGTDLDRSASEMSAAMNAVSGDSVSGDSASERSAPGESVTQGAIPPTGAEVANGAGVPPRVLDNSRQSTFVRVSVPDDAHLRTARRELTASMPQLELSIEADSAPLRILQLELIERQFKSGSPEHYVIRTLIAEAAWLVESVAQVEQRLSSLVAVYDVSHHELMSETFVGALRHAALPSTRSHMLNNGLRLADQLLMASASAECKGLVDALGPFAASLPGQVEHVEQVRQYLKDYSDAVELMNRYSDTIQRVVEQPGQMQSADLKVLGRHYCLMVRRWDEGLQWLTQSNDRQVARIAQQESRLNEAPTAEALKGVAGQWLAAAARSDGRAADSMRLHAIDLLRQAQPKAAGLAKLEIDRQLDDALSQVPPHLLPLPGDKVGSMKGTRSSRHVPAEGVPLF